MWSRAHHWITGWMIGLLYLIGIVYCGGGSSTTSSGAPKEGRIYLKNETDFILTVSYLNTERGTLQTVVQPGQQEEISQGVLLGDTKVKVHVISNKEPRGEPYKPEVDIEVTVDGNVIIQINQVGLYGNPAAWQYQILTE